MTAIVLTKDAWQSSQLSIARYYGSVCVEGQNYTIVDKRGYDILECSAEAAKEGRRWAIAPGEPADLCRSDFIPIYRKLGRERFFKFLEENPDLCRLKNAVKVAKERLKTWDG